MLEMGKLESKVNQISNEFGFREFNFSAEKFDTAQRALSRFVKSMNNRISRNEIENLDEIKVKLDLVSSLIKRLITVKFSEEPNLEKLKFIEENSTEELFNYHKNKLCAFMQKRFSKELKFNYTVLKNYQAYKFFFEQDQQAKEMYDKLVNSNRIIFDFISKFEKTTTETLEDALKDKNTLVKDFPELFNTKLIETADSVCKLNKEKITEINKDLAAKKKANLDKRKGKSSFKKAKPKKVINLGEERTKSKLNKVAYEDKSAGSNNPFAKLSNLKK